LIRRLEHCNRLIEAGLNGRLRLLRGALAFPGHNIRRERDGCESDREDAASSVHLAIAVIGLGVPRSSRSPEQTAGSFGVRFQCGHSNENGWAPAATIAVKGVAVRECPSIDTSNCPGLRPPGCHDSGASIRCVAPASTAIGLGVRQ